MSGMTKTLLAAALLLGATACGDDPTGPPVIVDGGPALAQSPGVLTFTSSQSYSNPTPQTASGGLLRIDFTGSVTTGTPCHTVTGSHTARGSNVTLTVTATRTGEICTQVVTHNNYQGSVSALTPGTYTFTVIHDVNNNRTTAFTGSVVVQ